MIGTALPPAPGRALQRSLEKAERALERPLGDRHALQADGEAAPRSYMMNMYSRPRFPRDQVARPPCRTHYRGRAGVDAELGSIEAHLALLRLPGLPSAPG